MKNVCCDCKTEKGVKISKNVLGDTFYVCRWCSIKRYAVVCKWLAVLKYLK
jgi:hypothetical protein